MLETITSINGTVNGVVWGLWVWRFCSARVWS